MYFCTKDLNASLHFKIQRFYIYNVREQLFEFHSVCSHFDVDKVERGPKEIFSPELQKELLVLEEQEASVGTILMA